jgi:hypothetical protein
MCQGYRLKVLLICITCAMLVVVCLMLRVNGLTGTGVTLSHGVSHPEPAQEQGVLQEGRGGASIVPPVKAGGRLVDVLANPPKPVDPSIAALMVMSKPLHDRISQQIDELKAESLLDSIANLTHQNVFFWPGPLAEAGTRWIPVPKECDQHTVDTILSCRRVLKVIDGLASMPKQEAGSIVSDQINRSITEYVGAFEAEWKGLLSKRRGRHQTGVHNVGFRIRVPTSSGGPRNLWGIRLQLLSLTMIAGDLELASARPSVLSVLKEARRQRECLYAESEAEPADRASILATSTLYNRQILATGILGTSTRMSDGPSKNRDNRWEERRLTMYDASDTPYDILTRNDGPIPADFSKGEIFVRFHGPLDDQGFDRLVKEVKEP